MAGKHGSHEGLNRGGILDAADAVGLAFDALPDGIIAVDGQGRVIAFNHAAADIFDLPASDVIGQALAALPGGPELAAVMAKPGASTWLGPATGIDGLQPFTIHAAILTTGGMRVKVASLRHAARRRSLDDRPVVATASTPRAAPQASPGDAVLTLDEDGFILAANAQAAAFFGHAPSQLVGEPITLVVPLVHGATLPASVGNFLKHDADGRTRKAEGRLQSGERVEIEIATSPILLGEQKCFIAVIYDCTEKRRTESALAETQTRLENISTNLPGMIFERILTAEGGLVYTFVSAGCRELLGIPPEALIQNGNLHLAAMAPDERAGFLARLRAAGEAMEPFHEEGSVLTPGGRLKWLQGRSRPRLLENGDIAWDGVVFDITARKTAEDKLAFLAFFDPMTGAANRTLFMERFTHARRAAEREDRGLAVLSLGLDRFSIINSTMGHEVGDQVLLAAAERLQSSLSPRDTLARVGGDRFLVLFANPGSPDELKAAVGRIQEAWIWPLVVNGEDYDLTVSIGISEFPIDGDDCESLIKHADGALSRAKAGGPGSVHYFTHDLGSNAARTLSTQNRLRRALDNGEFVPFYQPQIDLKTGRICGIEVLARWQTPDRGLVPPGEFIPVAEECGLIDGICEQILRAACYDARHWHDKGLPTVTVAVNLSGRQFHHSQDLLRMLDSVLTETNVDPRQIELELTESSAMRNAENAINVLKIINEMGISCSIDDFGTGYSSLSVLKRFPLSKLKIDRSFVCDAPDDLNDAAIVEAIIAMARALKLKVVAEGVETLEQLNFLRRLDCEAIQGFLFSPGVPAAEMEAMLAQNRTLTLDPLD